MIKIPALFQRVLANSPELNAAVNQNIKQFEPWLGQSGMPFFPGYTDHSPRHINDVLEAAASLIVDEGHELLTPEDAAVICVAALLHDCGMHLTQDGFRALIEDEGAPIVTGFGDKPWTQLWKDFIAEARRFGQERLVAIFGDDEPLRIDEIDHENLSERDYLLIGEFVRRHHARLAHEIAIRGVPSRNTEKLALTGISSELKDIAGLVARSHGMSIRDTFSYIEERYSLLPEQLGVKSPFLMAVIRIADYIQVQSERALKSLLSVKELRSPVSRQEWRNHFSVKNVSRWHDDPEAFFVTASPADVKTYLKLVSLFKDIQRELDESWATIGEVYGRRGDLAKLGLTMRRIRSNLDSSEKFARTVPYIPIKAGFDTSGPDLLKLLVGPLYDYQYEVGIRELIQNAVDACRELADFSSEAELVKGSAEEPDVLVDIQENEDGTGWITVTDKGVGMTLETITKYFLIAGASFRNSDLWKRQHTDESGQSRVMRGGRFGVGALAAFLLGDEIEVKTRHFARTETEGIEFKARIDEPNIELRRCVAPAGTSIKIWVSDSRVMERLRPYVPGEMPEGMIALLEKWEEVDWFVQEAPTLECRWHGYDGQKQHDVQRSRLLAKFIPNVKDCVPVEGMPNSAWARLADATPYKDIYWKYASPNKHSSGSSTWMENPNNQITVNGIRVQKISSYIYGEAARLEIPDEANVAGPHYMVRRPSLAIFDPAGVCPINLQRSAVAFERMGKDVAIASDVLRAHLRRLLPQAALIRTFAEFHKLCADFGDSPEVVYEGMASSICVTSKGVFLAAPNVFSKLKIQVLYFVSVPKKSIVDLKISALLREGEAIIFRQAAEGIQNDLAWFRGILSEDIDGWYSPAFFPKLTKAASIYIMHHEKWALANEKRRVKKEILNTVRNSPFDAKRVAARSGDDEYAEMMIVRCEVILGVLGIDAEIGGWIIQDEQPYAEQTSLLMDIWQDETGGALIQKFDIEAGKPR